MQKLVLAVALLALSSISWAASPDAAGTAGQNEAGAVLAQKNSMQTAPHSPFATADCSFTFTSGAKDTFLKYCVTVNGNVTVFQTPFGHEHVAVGSDGEGYGICDFSSNTAYADYAEAGDTANFGPSTVLSHTTTSVKIARSTTDGIWTLTQTFTQLAGTSPSVKIVMTLKNNTAIDRAVRLMRFVDVDANGLANNNLDSTVNAAFGWNSIGSNNGFGLVLQNVGTSPFDHGAFVQNDSVGPAPCNRFANASFTTLSATDGSLVHLYNITVPKSASKTVTVSYKGL